MTHAEISRRAPLQRVALTPETRPRWPVYIVQSLSSIGATLLMVGIFFYTEHYFRWGLKQNFLLACGQGAAYVAGSLLAQRIASHFGRRRGLIGIYLLLAILPVLAWKAPTAPIMIAALLCYTLVVALVWPILESLVSSDSDPNQLSRHVSNYNLVWSTSNATTFAASGAIMLHWRSGVFLIPVISHLVSALLMYFNPSVEPSSAQNAKTHAEPEPELLAKRKLAMWLARIALPATYVVVYSLMAMMPSLPVMRSLNTAQRTALGSVWMVARVLTFIYLGATIWWHTRPRILLLAAAGMLIAFLGVTIQPSELIHASNARGLQSPGLIAQNPVPALDIASMVGWQIALGALMGIIYASSLYFGMVLSDGSTEHGGYHEALIGLGSILGPGTAALTQLARPGDVRAGIVAVACVIGLSVIAAAAATISASRRPTG
jgi:predicted MFS family arabinose efflux permease